MLRASGNIFSYYHLLLDWGVQYGYSISDSWYSLKVRKKLKESVKNIPGWKGEKGGGGAFSKS